jgi:hypothetical protein
MGLRRGGVRGPLLTYGTPLVTVCCEFEPLYRRGDQVHPGAASRELIHDRVLRPGLCWISQPGSQANRGMPPGLYPIRN